MNPITVIDRTAVSDQDFRQILDALKNGTRDISTSQIQAKTLVVGDVEGGNYLEIEADGSLLLHGNATAFDDNTFPLSAYKLDSQAGALQDNYDNASITMNASGTLGTAADTLVFTSQTKHKTKEASSADLHVHWEQPTDQAYTFDVQYRIQNTGTPKTTTWSTLATVGMENNVFPYTSGTLLQITQLLDIDLTGISLSALVQFRLTRSDSTAGDIEAIAVDCHYEYDRLGSRTPYVA